jgi:TRAP-type C4-dicarboxylate transport system substrate-binding protein
MKAAIFKAALWAVALAVPVAPTKAEEVTLVFAPSIPPQQTPGPQVLKPWAEQVNAAGKGIVQLDIREGTAVSNGGNFFDRVQNGVVNIAWGVTGAIGSFLLSDAARIPYVGEKAEHASVAMWRLYKSGLLDHEYRDTRPLEFGAYAPASFHLARAPKSIEDLSGLRLIANSKLAAQAIAMFGATPTTILISDAYSALQRHTVEGIVTGYPGIPPYKLQEVVNTHISANMGGGMSFLIMAKKKFDSLPAAAQKLIDDNSGEALSRKHGAFNDSDEQRARNMLKALPDQTVIEPTAAQHEIFRKRLAPLADEWSKSIPGAVPVLAKYRELLAQVQKGN